MKLHSIFHMSTSQHHGKQWLDFKTAAGKRLKISREGGAARYYYYINGRQGYEACDTSLWLCIFFLHNGRVLSCTKQKELTSINTHSHFWCLGFLNRFVFQRINVSLFIRLWINKYMTAAMMAETLPFIPETRPCFSDSWGFRK